MNLVLSTGLSHVGHFVLPRKITVTFSAACGAFDSAAGFGGSCGFAGAGAACANANEPAATAAATNPTPNMGTHFISLLLVSPRFSPRLDVRHHTPLRAPC